MIFKAQPLNLIEKYFGTELGMYFAWIEFYVSYLIPASIVGILSFILGSVNTYLTDGTHVTYFPIVIYLRGWQSMLVIIAGQKYARVTRLCVHIVSIIHYAPLHH